MAKVEDVPNVHRMHHLFRAHQQDLEDRAESLECHPIQCPDRVERADVGHLLFDIHDAELPRRHLIPRDAVIPEDEETYSQERDKKGDGGRVERPGLGLIGHRGCER